MNTKDGNMKNEDIEAIKDRINQEAKYVNMVNEDMNYKEGFNLWFIGLIFLGMIIGFFIGKI